MVSIGHCSKALNVVTRLHLVEVKLKGDIMSDVKRYSLEHRPGHGDGSFMGIASEGEYVLHSDYAAVKAERDVLAKATIKDHCWKEFFDTYVPDGATHYCTACRGHAWDRDGEGDEDGVFDARHKPDCPLALAEKIVKEEK